MDLLLRKTKELEGDIDAYLDLVVTAALVFREAIRYYVENELSQFEDYLRRADEMEGKGDALRRSIENRLYTETLIPESRGDVLGLLESTDRVLNHTAETLAQFDVETPKLLPEHKQMFIDLAAATGSSIESMVLAIRAYFREPEKVRDQINKTMFFEKETDIIAMRIKRAVYRTDIQLSRKIHIRNFVQHIEEIADEAEDVCDRLAIATIKRHL